METFRIRSKHNAAQFFSINADTMSAAAHGALYELGWTVARDVEELPFVVLYIDPDMPLLVNAFECTAEDDIDAEELCKAAYPTADVVWVVQGTDAGHAYGDYWGFITDEDAA
jgi:hypothetical protein